MEAQSVQVDEQVSEAGEANGAARVEAGEADVAARVVGAGAARGAVDQAGGSDAAPTLEDGRTRCSWVRGRPEHHLFHDAEWGRLPDTEAPVFERVLFTCLSRGLPLVDVLDQRMAIFEAFAEWDYEKVAAMTDEEMDALTARGGVFADGGALRRIRDAATSCIAIKNEFKGLLDYFLTMPALLPEEQLTDVAARFSGFDKDDAARLIQLMGCVGGSVQQWSHERDCWIY